MFLVYFLTAALLFVIGLAVAFAGEARILNLVDYRRVTNPAALHRWAGQRLIAVAALVALLGFAAFRWPAAALPLLPVLLLVVGGGVVWLAIGSTRFQES